MGRSGCLYVVSGPSGAGKSSVVSRLRQRRPLYFSVSATTRARRPGELDGVHYWFVDPSDFDELVEQGQFLEWAQYNGRNYGTLLQPVLDRLAAGEDVLLEIEVQGAAQIRSGQLPAFMFFVVPPSLGELGRRLRNRGDTSEVDIARRMAIAEAEMDLAPQLFDYAIVNDDLERCVAEIDALMSAVCPP